MKGIQKIQLAAIALAVAQFVCTSAYAEASSTQGEGTTARMVYKSPQCLEGDGNSFLSASPQTTVNTEEQKQELAVRYVKELERIFNFTPTQAAGIVANLLWESGLNSGMKNMTGSVGEAVKYNNEADKTGYGIAQWIEGRKFKLIELAGIMNIPTSSQCANFTHLGSELVFNTDFTKVVSAMLAEKTLVGAVCTFEKMYEMPKDPNSQKRIDLAKQVMTWLGVGYVAGHGSATGDACDYFPGPQPDGLGGFLGPEKVPNGGKGGNQSFVSQHAVVPDGGNSGGGGGGGGGFSTVPDGFASAWNIVRVSNTTKDPITALVTMGAGQPFPSGVDPSGKFVVMPGKYVDLTFALNTGPNIRSLYGDGSVYNQAEFFIEEKTHFIWWDVSYINGANSNVRMFCSDGVHSGYLGDVIAGAPPAAKVGDWGVMAPYDRFHHTDVASVPGSAVGGPNGPQNAGGKYLYSILKKGEGYVNRGKEIQVDEYDDASSLACTGKIAVVF